tara:strand:- start:76 stop:249 length:174 start_codon:yes stop_codon:yes gene_type:complete
MTDFAVESFPAWKAILWCFYPFSIVVLIELFLRASDNDDDDEGGGGIMIPAYAPSGS